MAATDVNSDFYANQVVGLVPLEQAPRWYFFHHSDSDIGGDLAEDGDVFRVAKFDKNTVIYDVMVIWGDHDSGGTPAFAAHLSINAAVNGNSAASFIVIASSTKGQAGGVDRADNDAVLDGILGLRIEANGAYVFLENDVAPATATATRTAVVGVLAGKYANTA